MMQEDPGQYQMKWLRYMKSSLISVKCYEINNSRKTDGSNAESTYMYYGATDVWDVFNLSVCVVFIGCCIAYQNIVAS